MKELILSGNCYWCLEAVFQKIQGVEKAESGFYSLRDYDFKFIPEDKLESVKITYDENVISLNTILDIFYQSHTPTLNSWKKEDCFSYLCRSSIICFDDEQVKCAEEKIKEVNSNKLFDQDAQTKIIRYINSAFRLVAEKERNYYLNNPTDGYCTSIINPKLDKIKDKFPKYFTN
jgi:peptide-methionine (S)-S-oxide reductase